MLFQRLLVYWALLTLGPVLIAASLSITSALMSVADIPEHPLLVGATSSLLRYLPFILEVVAFVLFYKSIPNTDVRFSHAMSGGIVAALMFELAKQGFAYYIVNFPSYQVIYGALATIPIFFIWVYLSWLVMLVGAVVAAVLGRRQARRSGGGIDLVEAERVVETANPS
jgi:membrane protein